MASPFSLLPFFISLLSLLTLSLSFNDHVTLKLSHSPFIAKSNLWQKLNHLTSSSLARAHLLKNPSESPDKLPLFPQSYGGYSISLSFGSPPQTLSFIMDTGSSLVWFPCTHRYRCSDCNFSNIDPKDIPTFIPNLSSSAMVVGCKNKKCELVFGSVFAGQCNVGQICPAYMVQYGSGSTTGVLLSDTLDLPGKKVTDFAVGCSFAASRQPSGIAGFGRNPGSLPIQMGLKKFSYCLVSHRFDDTPVSSDLVLVSGSDSGSSNKSETSYTPFRKNPSTSNTAFQDYYYITLRKITIGGKQVKLPYSFLVPGPDGNGGTIIDSATTFTMMDSGAFDPVAKEFEKQMSQYERAVDVENQTGLRPCFNVPGEDTIDIPDLVFHFKGGSEMGLPPADVFSFVGSSVVCMTIVSSSRNVSSEVVKLGPSIIIGNYQQQNFYMEYDLENERLGFRKQNCIEG